ncbi:MAG TPA: hypothetical protein VKK31_22185 [Thermoanaerobaculia bacterium]|nr:hypothetical protein [Thermoanaerobaculia bacterium]
MTKVLRTLIVLLFALVVIATRPAPAVSNCDYLVTCFDYLPKQGYPDPSWQYSHVCCDLNNHSTIWNVYIDFRGKWHLVSSNILP